LVGRHTVDALVARHWHVTVVGRGVRPERLDARVVYKCVDLTAPGAVEQLFSDGAADVLVHLAWYTELGRFWDAPENLDWVAASLRLVRGFADAGGRRVVAAGTCVEYEAPGAGPCVAGTTPVAPKHLYAVAKDTVHRLTSAFCLGQGLSYAWGRVFLLTGPDEAPRRLVPSIVRSLLAGQPARCTSGRQVRDLMDTRDCGAAFAQLAAIDRSGAIDICSGEPVTIADVAGRIGALMGRSDLIQLGALPDRAGDPPNIWGDAHALREWGFTPRFTLDSALSNAIEYWRVEGGKAAAVGTRGSRT
jgi:nucleoside-diphosphate-sugar epimerase